MTVRLVDLGDQDGWRWDSAQELLDHANTCVTLAKGLALGRVGAVVLGMGKGNRMVVGRGAGMPDCWLPATELSGRKA